MLFIGYQWLLNLIWKHVTEKKKRKSKSIQVLLCSHVAYTDTVVTRVVCTQSKKKPHTNTRNNNRRKSTNNGTSSWHPAEVEQKNTRRHKTKQHQVVFQPGLTLPLPHSLSLSLSFALCYRQSIFKAETERYSQIQPMTVAPMSVDSILLLTCVSLSLRATDGVFLPESLLSSHPVGLAQWKHWLKRVLHCKFFDYLHFWHSVRAKAEWLGLSEISSFTLLSQIFQT